jgi:hypothetical protein
MRKLIFILSASIFLSLFALGQDHNSLWLTDGLNVVIGMKAEQLRQKLSSEYSIRVDGERTWVIKGPDGTPIGHVEINKEGIVWQVSRWHNSTDGGTVDGFQQFFRILERMIWTEKGKLEIPPFPTSIDATVETYQNKEQQWESFRIIVGKRSFDVTIHHGGSYPQDVSFQEFITDYNLAGIKSDK